MGWSRDALKGTMKVFRFSLSQQMKSRVNIVTFLILFLLAAGCIPVMALTMGGKSVRPSQIQTVYVKNDTDFQLDLREAPQADQSFDKTEFEEADFDQTDYASNITDDQVFAKIGEGAGGYAIDLYTLETSSLDEEDLEPLEQVLRTVFENARLRAAGASAAQVEALGTGVQTQVLSQEEFLNPEETDWEAGFTLQYIYAIIVLMLCIMSSSYIVRAIAEEKSSKLVELLMVSVRPLSLLLGKVLATMTYLAALIAVLILGAGASYVVTGRFLDVSMISLSAVLGMDAGGLNLGVGLGLVVAVALVLGYLTFSLLAGLAGCCCVSMDDVEGANMKVVLLVMAGYLVSCVTSAMPSGAVSVFSSLFPFVSVFCAPVQFALGNIGIGVVILSWIIQAAVIAGVAVFSAKVYNDLIIYRGGKIGLGRLLSMAGRKGGEKA